MTYPRRGGNFFISHRVGDNDATLSIILYFKMINFYDKFLTAGRGVDRSMPFSLLVNLVRRSTATIVAMDLWITAYCGHWRFLVKCHIQTFIAVNRFKIVLLNG